MKDRPFVELSVRHARKVAEDSQRASPKWYRNNIALFRILCSDFNVSKLTRIASLCPRIDMASASAPNFAPSASEAPRHQLGGIGAYKELAPVSFSRETELKGTDRFKPASFPHYLPVWDNEKDVGK